jgi:hypothetical protein
VKPPAGLAALQRLAGNRAVTALVAQRAAAAGDAPAVATRSAGPVAVPLVGAADPARVSSGVSQGLGQLAEVAAAPLPQAAPPGPVEVPEPRLPTATGDPAMAAAREIWTGRLAPVLADGRGEVGRLLAGYDADTGRERAATEDQVGALADGGRGELAARAAETVSAVVGRARTAEQDAAGHLAHGEQQAAQVRNDAQRAREGGAVSRAWGWLRSTAGDLWSQATAAIGSILRRARDLAQRAVDGAVSFATGVLGRFLSFASGVVGRIRTAVAGLLARTAGWLRAAWARLRSAAAALAARVRGWIGAILRPVRVRIGPIQAFPRLPVSGVHLKRLSTGTIPVAVEPIPTPYGVIVLFLTMRTDGDLVFSGGGVGPGMIDALELVVDPLGGRYRAKADVSAAADATGGAVLTGTYGGGASWMGVAGLGVDGGLRIPLLLTVRGAARAKSTVEYHRGTVTVLHGQDLEFCLVPHASVDAFIKIKAFTGLPFGPGGDPGEVHDCCPTCAGPEPEDPGGIAYEELVLFEHWWNLENYQWEKCWRWRFGAGAVAGPGGAAAGAGGRLDTSSAPALFDRIHQAAAASTTTTPAGARIAAIMAGGGSGGGNNHPTPNKTPSGSLDIPPTAKHHPGERITYGDGRHKHSRMAHYSVNELVALANTVNRPDTTHPDWMPNRCAFIRAVKLLRGGRGDIAYGSQLGDVANTKAGYEALLLLAFASGRDDRGVLSHRAAVALGIDLLQGSGGATQQYVVEFFGRRPDGAHVVPGRKL